MAKRLTAAEKEQQHFEGLAPERNPKVHKAALVFMDLKDDAKLASKKAKEAGETLVRVMHEQKVTAYEYDKLKVRLDSKDTAKVKVVAAAKAPKKPRKKKGEDAQDEAPVE